MKKTRKTTIPPWGKEVRKILIDKDMSTPELAKALGLSRSYVNQIINGTLNYPESRKKISDYLGISAD